MAFLTKKAISRRRVLQGIGAGVALPLLDSMIPSSTALAQTAAVPVKRFGAVFVPHGERPGFWTPEEGWQVTAIDFSGAGLRKAAEHAAERGVADRIEFRQADLRAWAPEGEQWDLVTSCFLHLLDHSLKAERVQIFIGHESGYQILDDCSVVTAPYADGDSVIGVLGVIGPTRMAYERVIPIVDMTAKLLGAALNSRR